MTETWSEVGFEVNFKRQLFSEGISELGSCATNCTSSNVKMLQIGINQRLAYGQMGMTDHTKMVKDGSFWLLLK